jgi:hypothetical protein
MERMPDAVLAEPPSSQNFWTERGLDPLLKLLVIEHRGVKAFRMEQGSFLGEQGPALLIRCKRDASCIAILTGNLFLCHYLLD